jgi:hypothetical protein
VRGCFLIDLYFQENGMDIERFCVKFFARLGVEVDDALFIDIFHEWIRHKKLGGILLDVADYRHVPEGPGIMLITHEINFAMDYSEGRFGLLAQRKAGAGGSYPERILELVRATAAFGTLLEDDPHLEGRLRLEAGTFHYIANDRLAASNDDLGFAALKPDLEAAASLIYPDRQFSVSRVENDPRDRLTAVVEAGPVDMVGLLETLVVAA